MTIKNKITGIVIDASIVYRRSYKCVKFMGVTIKIDSKRFTKHWAIL